MEPKHHRDFQIDCRNCGTERYQSPSGKYRCPKCTLTYSRNNKEKINTRNKRNYDSDKEKKRKEKRNPDYTVWIAMKQRCFNRNYRNYHNYGGRGITVCDRWENSFENFIADVGPRPDPRHLYSIDRYPDRNGNYEPGNCRWATSKEQNNNQRTNRLSKQSVSENNVVGYQGKYVTLTEFSNLTGIHLEAVKYRWCQHPSSSDRIIHDDYDNRDYEWNGHKYNMSELSYISGIRYVTIQSRIKDLCWSVSDALEIPVKRKDTVYGIYR